MRSGRTQGILAASLILLGVLLRAPVLFAFHGPFTAHGLNLDLMEHVGAYSDISHLYFRDHLAAHPIPYLDFPFEYPVLTGLFVWVADFVHTSVGAYFLTSAALLAGIGAATVWAIRRIEGSNPWLFAAAPALALYGTLNWDLLGICLMTLALLLFQRDRDGLGAGTLALATWAKLFPIVLLPLILVLRLADGRRRSAVRIVAVFLLTSLAVNLPFALTAGADGPIRENWSYFFSFTAQRAPYATIWEPVLGRAADEVSGPLLLAGLAAILLTALRARNRSGGSLAPASAASLLWVFAAAKVYSPQYALWIFAALAIDGAPVGLAVVFGLVDVLIFTTTFGPLYPSGPVSGFPVAVQWGAYGLRQLVTAWLAIWLVRRDLGSPAPELEAAEPMAAR